MQDVLEMNELSINNTSVDKGRYSKITFLQNRIHFPIQLDNSTFK